MDILLYFSWFSTFLLKNRFQIQNFEKSSTFWPKLFSKGTNLGLVVPEKVTKKLFGLSVNSVTRGKIVSIPVVLWPKFGAILHKSWKKSMFTNLFFFKQTSKGTKYDLLEFFCGKSLRFEHILRLVALSKIVWLMSKISTSLFQEKWK